MPELSSDQIFMRDKAHRLLAERAGSAALRGAIDAGGFDAGLWRTVGTELGWCAVVVPEECGGLGLGALDLVLMAEQAGRRLAPIPYWSTACLAAPLIAASATQERRATLLTRIAAGEAACVALPSPGSTTPLANLSVTAVASAQNYSLDGRVSPVLDLESASIIVLPATLPDGAMALFALAPDAGHAVRPLESIDLLRPAAELVLDGVAVPASARMDCGDITPAALEEALAIARLGLAADQIGAAQGALDITLAYVAERVQFGRAIASFQAVKHRCAALVVAIAEARSLLYGAAAAHDSGAPEAGAEIAAAGALASDVCFRAAEEAIQFHGGVGNTFDYDPHLYLRRAQASASLLGTADDRMAEVAAFLLGDAL